MVLRVCVVFSIFQFDFLRRAITKVFHYGSLEWGGDMLSKNLGIRYVFWDARIGESCFNKDHRIGEGVSSGICRVGD